MQATAYILRARQILGFKRDANAFRGIKHEKVRLYAVNAHITIMRNVLKYCVERYNRTFTSFRICS